MNTVDKTLTGLMSRNPTEIARVLDKAKNEHAPVTAFFPDLTFSAPLVLVDPRGGRIVLDRSRDDRANRALLSRPRCAFHIELAGWHIEFVSAQPQAVSHQRRQLIQCRFPEILASNPRRGQARFQVQPPLPLRVQADEDGFMPFDGLIMDVALGGLAFLVYASNITLEPGTVLRGCHIQLPGTEIVTDLEVRYTQAITLPNGRRAMRSGCRFLKLCPQIEEIARRLGH